MSVFFTTDRGIPAELRNADGVGRYGDTGSDIMGIVSAASPWNFLKGVFVDKPAAQQQAQLELAQTQASAAIAMQQEADIQKRGTMKMLMYAGVGIAGLIVLSAMMRRPRAAPAAVAGYRKSRRKSRRSRP